MTQSSFYFFRQNVKWAFRTLKALVVLALLSITALVEFWHYARH